MSTLGEFYPRGRGPLRDLVPISGHPARHLGILCTILYKPNPHPSILGLKLAAPTQDLPCRYICVQSIHTLDPPPHSWGGASTSAPLGPLPYLAYAGDLSPMSLVHISTWVCLPHRIHPLASIPYLYPLPFRHLFRSQHPLRIKLTWYPRDVFL